MPEGPDEPTAERAAAPPPLYLDARGVFAERFLRGKGLEIGALHQPLAIPPQARVRYLDRLSVDELRREYPELAEWELVEVDVTDDGETLETVEDGSQDFIVANHFLEHCEDPIGTIETHLAKVKPGGILFYAVPDKRYTFDFRREPTSLSHIVEDYERGGERSRAQHYEEWARFVSAMEGDIAETAPAEKPAEWVSATARRLERAAYSIHMHVWTQAEFLRLILDCRRRFADAFDIEAAARQAIEFIVVLRKSGGFPQPPPSPPPASPPPATLAARIRRTLAAARHELRRTS